MDITKCFILKESIWFDFFINLVNMKQISMWNKQFIFVFFGGEGRISALDLFIFIPTTFIPIIIIEIRDKSFD